MTKEEIIKYAMKTPENTNPNILRSMVNSLLKENTSDFTTCTVTIVNNSEYAIDFYLPNITESDAHGEPCIGADAYSPGMRSRDELTCVLYKGKAVGAFPLNSRPLRSNVTTSGSISYDYDANFIIITGDGTITIDY